MFSFSSTLICFKTRRLRDFKIFLPYNAQIPSLTTLTNVVLMAAKSSPLPRGAVMLARCRGAGRHLSEANYWALGRLWRDSLCARMHRCVCVCVCACVCVCVLQLVMYTYSPLVKLIKKEGSRRKRGMRDDGVKGKKRRNRGRGGGKEGEEEG